MANITPAGENPPWTLLSVLAPVKPNPAVPEAPKPPEPSGNGNNVDTQA